MSQTQPNPQTLRDKDASSSYSTENNTREQKFGSMIKFQLGYLVIFYISLCGSIFINYEYFSSIVALFYSSRGGAVSVKNVCSALPKTAAS